MRIPSALTLFALTALAAGLCGCSMPWNAPAPVIHQFAIESDPPRRAAPAGAPQVALRFIETAPAFENQEFVYRLGDDRWESDFYHRFSDSPSDMLTALTRRCLARGGVWSDAAIPGLAPRGAYLMEGYTAELYGDFQNREHPQAVLAMQFALFEPGRHVRSQPLLEVSYRRSAPVAATTPEALVQAWSAAFREIMRALESDTRNALAKPRVEPVGGE